MTGVSEPLKNPFPYQATFSLEARGTDMRGKGTLPPTLLVPAVKDVRGFMAVYLERFGDSRAAPGQVLLLHGEHGSGKTHAVGFGLATVREGEVRLGGRVRATLELYIKAETSDFVTVYHRLMTQIPEATLRELEVRFLGAVAGETVADSGHTKEAVERTEGRLRADPEFVFGLLEEYLVEPSAVLGRHEERVRDVTGGDRDFRRALSYLLTDLGDLAYRWLVGYRLAEVELKRLGLSKNIDTPARARAGLQLLATLCGRASTALILCLDQYEKLVLDENGLDEEIAGQLHTLTEVLPRQDAMLIVSGSNEAWEALPRDLRQRFGYNVVECVGLDLDETVGLVDLYLNPQRESPVAPEIPEERLRPFTLDALRLAHQHSRGNVRRLLQVCSAAFESLTTDRPMIDEDVIREVVGRLEEPPVDVETASGEIRRLAAARGFVVVSALDNGPPAHLELHLRGTVRLLVLISDASYYLDEIFDATEQVDLIERLQQAHPGAHTVVVALGYDSPEVRALLQRSGVETLAYRGDTFDQRFSDVLDAAAQTGATGSAVAETLEEVKRTLKELRIDREVEHEALNAGTASLSERQGLARLEARWQAASDQWVAERRRLAEAIREARQARREKELAELERLRESSERQRRRGLSFTSLGFALLAVAIVAWPSRYAIANSQGTFDALTIALVVAAIVGIACLFAFLFRQLEMGPMGFVRPRAIRELAAPIVRLDDLRRLAYTLREGRLRMHHLLRQPNPQIRYVASVVARDRDDYERLMRALLAERSPVVCRAFARELGRSEEAGSEAVSLTVANGVPEAVYVLEAALDRDMDAVPSLPKRSPPALQALWAMGHDQHLGAVTRVFAHALPWDTTTGLDEAIRAGMRFEDRHILMRVPAELIRNRAAALSPLEPGGLGTFDELEAIAEVDNAYLTISQLLFFWELGLLLDA